MNLEEGTLRDQEEEEEEEVGMKTRLMGSRNQVK